MAEQIEAHVFAAAAQLIRTMIPDGVGEVHTRSHRRGLKVWFGPAKPTPEQYEAQVIPGHLAGGSGPLLEVGFHAEHGDEAMNQQVADQLETNAKVWRGDLGPEAELGTFLGRESWRRLSEVWPDAGQLDDDPDAAFEIACRLIDYISVIEPLRNE